MQSYLASQTYSETDKQTFVIYSIHSIDSSVGCELFNVLPASFKPRRVFRFTYVHAVNVYAAHVCGAVSVLECLCIC